MSRVMNRIIDRLRRTSLVRKVYHPLKLLVLFRNVKTTRLILQAEQYSLMDYTKLAMLYRHGERLEKKKIGGSFIECGVYNGGSAAVIAGVVKDNENRQVWLLDSFEGFPSPGEEDYNIYLDQAAEEGGTLGLYETAHNLIFEQLRLDESRVHIVKGWFEDTVPDIDTGSIALLHLDCDLYESVKYCLESFYDSIVPGGCIIVDDYGYWTGCKQAVDEFIASRSLEVEMIKYGKPGREGIYFLKSPTSR